MQKQELLIFIFILGLFLPFYYVSAGTILSTNKYAWSNNVGYINFENVTVGDSTLGGHAWSANKGFINFSPAQGGVLNNGTGNLSGSAWGEQLGWIDFDNVSINSSTGQFSGTATGTLVGTITFDCPNYCDVQTDWRPVSSTPTPIPTATPTPTATSSGGGGGGGGGAPISTVTQTPAVTPTTPVQESAESAQAKLIDIQKDGAINILDFNAMMVNWGLTQNLAVIGNLFNSADMNSDGVVDIFDFNTLMVYWDITYQL